VPGETDLQHIAVFYGKSKDGTLYFLTKNGMYNEPTIMTIRSIEKRV